MIYSRSFGSAQGQLGASGSRKLNRTKVGHSNRSVGGGEGTLDERITSGPSVRAACTNPPWTSPFQTTLHSKKEKSVWESDVNPKHWSHRLLVLGKFQSLCCLRSELCAVWFEFRINKAVRVIAVILLNRNFLFLFIQIHCNL